MSWKSWEVRKMATVYMTGMMQLSCGKGLLCGSFQAGGFDRRYSGRVCNEF